MRISILTLSLLIAALSFQSNGSTHSKDEFSGKSRSKRQQPGGKRNFNFNRKRQVEWRQRQYSPRRQRPQDTDFLDLTNAKVGRFEAKHLYLDGLMKDKWGNLVLTDSFKDLSTREVGWAKRYLIELNAKMFKGNILPGLEVEHWLERANKGNIKVTVVDATIEQLKQDISSKFKKWLEDNPVLVDRNGRRKLVSNFETEDEYLVTQLTFRGNKKSPNEPTRVQVVADQIRSTILVAPDQSGKPYHFHAITGNEEDRILKSTVVGEFSGEELRHISKVTQEFWENLGLSLEYGSRPMLLNTDNNKYQRLKAKLDQDLKSFQPTEVPVEEQEGTSKYTCTCGRRKKRSAGCAFCVSESGEVESVHEQEFVEEYKKGNAKAKKELADIAREHLDKVQAGGGEGGANNVEKLVHLEDMKEHFAAAETVNKAYDAPHNIIEEHESAGTKIELHEAFEHVEHEFRNVRSKVRVSPSKVSEGIHRMITSKAVVGIAEGISGVGNHLGKFFFAKTIITGIVHDDKTTLAVIGTRVGYEVATSTAVWAGTKFFSAASKVGEATKILGKVAGPIGAAFDIGISIWSLTDSVRRLNNATDKYARNDAMASVISDSVSIATTATVLAVSVAFPPAAPIAMAVGLVVDLVNRLATSIYQAENEVARINSEVPLLDFEKERVFTSRFFDWFGTRTPDYIDSMVKEKQANDLAVQQNLKFLEDNEAFGGIVFPSRTMAYKGACNLKRWVCNNGADSILGCIKWSLDSESGTCDWRKPCPNGDICDDFVEPISCGVFTCDVRYWYECKCDGEATTTFGYPREDQYINFRFKERVYWERAVPKDVENAKFLCKPGNENFMGYMVSEETSKENEYYCRDAIGLRQPDGKWIDDKPLIFDLGNGNDFVYLDDFKNPNIFLMGSEGTKRFSGSRFSSNEFVFDTNVTESLTGLFKGGNKDNDRITLGRNFTKGQRISLDFSNGELTSEDGRLRMTFNSIEEIIGREGEPEHLKVKCANKKVVLGGGNANNPDEIEIPALNCGNDMHLTILGAKNTNIKSEVKTGDMAILIMKDWENMNLDLDVYQKEDLHQSVVFLNTSSSDIKGYKLDQDNDGRKKLTLQDDSHQIIFNFKYHSEASTSSLHFTETPKGSPYSVLVISKEKESTPVFYHSLPEISDVQLVRTGSSHMSNLFDITGEWEVTGGSLEDNFILHDNRVKTLDGGDGDDTIKLHPDFKDELNVDLTSDQYKNIENIYGVAGVPLTVKSGCNTKLVAPQGGSGTQTDIIKVSDLFQCDKTDMQIVAAGHSQVLVEGEVAKSNTVTVIVPQRQDNRKLRFWLSTLSTNTKNLQVAIALLHRDWKVLKAERTKDSILHIELKGKSSDEKIVLNLKDDPEVKTPYLPSPNIQLILQNSTQPFGTMVIERETENVMVLFDLNQTELNEDSVLEGFKFIQNAIHMNANTSKDWSVEGGELNDVFTITASEYISGGKLHLDGGNGEDVLIIDGEKNPPGSPYVVNLAKGNLGFLKTPEEERGSVANIEEVHGRSGSPDIIHVGCTTKAVNGLGGAGEGVLSDMIIISELDCEPKTSIAVGKHTVVKNSAENGTFTYQVEDILTSSLELNPTATNKHHVKFNNHPWDVIMKTAFNDETQELGLMLLNGSLSKADGGIKVFKMSKRDNDSNEFDNPVLYFHPRESAVTSELRVRSDGVITSTIMIRSNDNMGEDIKGLSVDVNRFLINMTEPFKNVSIEGCNDGNRCSGNQFWIFNLESPIQSLDGGGCDVDTCSNYLHFASTLNIKEPVVHLDQENGYLAARDGTVYIRRLKNIDEFEGTPDTKVYTTCNTRSVSNVGQVVIKPDVCSMDLLISVDNFTTVAFDDMNSDEVWGKLNMTQRSEAIENRTIHYRFNEPMSFTPTGSYLHMLTMSHYYYMPFDLSELDEIKFDKDEEVLNFFMNGSGYNYGMLSHPGYDEQFFSSPSIVTSDKFSIQISRDGSILATFGGEDGHWTEESTPELEELANKLGVTLIIQTDDYFFHAEYSTGKDGDRNVLENVPDKTSVLMGGGDQNAFYEINFFDSNIIIHSGFDEESYPDWEKNENRTKQTIDLTDIVVPIRLRTGTKYVPLVEQKDDDLIIRMHDHGDEYPAILSIVNGSHPWVAHRLQLLLSHCMMDLVPNNGDERNFTVSENLSERRKRDVGSGNSTWRLHPRPIRIPHGYTVFGISREELEDGHDIHMEAGDHNLVDAIHGYHVTAVKNGSDLFLTNLQSPRNASSKTIVISDYYRFQPLSIKTFSISNNSETQDQPGRKPALLPNSLFGITLHLNEKPHLVVHESGSVLAIKHNNETENVEHEPLSTVEWSDLLHQRESQLLEGLPDIEKVFQKNKACNAFCAASAYL